MLGLGALACEPGGVGDPCIPEDEYQTTFGGYDPSEVNVESRSFQCETRVCLVNHFQGRVSCPYGQTEADVPANPACPQCTGNLAGTDPKRCRIPGTSGQLAEDVINVPVPAQLVRRTAAASPKHGGEDVQDSVYCSCRCKNADGSKDDGARYCDCPSGFSCEKLIDDLGLGSSQLAGYYCIKSGSNKNLSGGGAECSFETKNCTEGGAGNP